MIPFPKWPQFEQDEQDAALRVLKSGNVNYWTGDEGKQFESEFAAFSQVNHAIAVANGTLALELAIHALGPLNPGDEVIVPCRTFIATASAVVMQGGIPVTADIDLISQNITVETIKDVLTKKTKGIICVHLAGWPCEMDAIMAFARAHGLWVIEDCAQAHGAAYKNKPVGSWGDVGAFSFCQDKIMTTGGEGGMIVTNNESLWHKAWAYKDHGKHYDTVYNKTHPPGFRWLHESFGTNFRLTEMQSAIGRIQLKKLPSWTKKRQENAKYLTNELSKNPLFSTHTPDSNYAHAYYKYYCSINNNNRDSVTKQLTQAGIPCFSGSCYDISLEKAFNQRTTSHTNAKILGEKCLMFLVHPTITTTHLDQLIDQLHSTTSI